jgi:hypothetical protein
MQSNQSAVAMRCHLKPFRLQNSYADTLQIAKIIFSEKFKRKVRR